MDSSSSFDRVIYNDEVKGTLTLKLNEEESEETPTTSSSETSNSHPRLNERNPETFQHVMEWCAINMMNSSCEKDKNGRCKYQKLTRGGQNSAICLIFRLYVSFRERNRKIRNRKVRVKNKLIKIEQYSAFQEDIYKKFGIHFQVNVNSFRIDYKALYLYQHLHDYAPQGIISVLFVIAIFVIGKYFSFT